MASGLLSAREPRDRGGGGGAGQHATVLVPEEGKGDDDEAVVVRQCEGDVLVLNQVAARVLQLVGEGLAPDEIVDRFCVLGPVEAHIEKLEELRKLGVDHFGLYLMHDDIEGTIRAYGEQVIPALS